MQQLNLFQSLSLSVTDLTRYLRQLLEMDPVLQDVWVQGEVSNLSRPSSGHIYFTLKDDGAALKCVIWRSSAARIRFAIQNGMAIEAHGAISLYERDGQYQLYVTAVRPAGEGQLYQQFMRMKAALEAEGLFDESFKRPIPDFPARIGIVTSATGAALQDMLNTLRLRCPLVEVILAPCAVQGLEAPGEIVTALRRLNDSGLPDVIILARGGGSLEDLWAFNDERVVRAIRASAVPVVTGVGHETDFTLADFAADLRAPTPTGAAVAATPDIADLKSALNKCRSYLAAAFESVLDEQRAELGHTGRRLVRASPMYRVQNGRQRLDDLQQNLERTCAHALQLRRAGWRGQGLRLQNLDPRAVMKRGYAIVRRADDNHIVTSVAQVQPGVKLDITVADGSFGAQAGTPGDEPGKS